MDQKEQKVVTPKVTVTVERHGKTSTVNGKGIIAFIQKDDGVRVLLNYNCNFEERVAFLDAICYVCSEMLNNEPELREAVLALPAPMKEEIFVDGEES